MPMKSEGLPANEGNDYRWMLKKGERSATIT